jgi:hypothetical protein
VCEGCGSEWVEDHSQRYAPPWSEEDEQRVADLRRHPDFKLDTFWGRDEYRRLRQLETLESSRRRTALSR